MSSFRISDKSDILRVKSLTGLREVVLDSKRIKYQGLLLHALKYALWAVRPYGIIRVKDNGPDHQGILPWTISFPIVRQICQTVLGPYCEPPVICSASREIMFRRSKAVPQSGWSAGVVFSGQEAEIPTLRRCLHGLVIQDELMPPLGEIVVCGPERDNSFLEDFPDVRYINYELPPEKPFPICAKKDFLISHLKGPRVIILHSRIVLLRNALNYVPLDFDFATPSVFLETPRGLKPNVCFIGIDGRSPYHVPKRLPVTTRHISPASYLDVLAKRRAYIDGGVFFAMKASYDLCPLNLTLKWGDAEDVEWCRRAEALGLLVDLFPESKAVSQTFKVSRAHEFPKLIHRSIILLNKVFVYCKGLTRYIVESIMQTYR